MSRALVTLAILIVVPAGCTQRVEQVPVDAVPTSTVKPKVEQPQPAAPQATNTTGLPVAPFPRLRGQEPSKVDASIDPNDPLFQEMLKDLERLDKQTVDANGLQNPPKAEKRDH